MQDDYPMIFSEKENKKDLWICMGYRSVSLWRYTTFQIENKIVKRFSKFLRGDTNKEVLMEGAHHDRGRGLGYIGKSVRWGGKTDTRKVRNHLEIAVNPRLTVISFQFSPLNPYP